MMVRVLYGIRRGDGATWCAKRIVVSRYRRDEMRTMSRLAGGDDGMQIS
jgi:hypothetical protein